MNIINSNGFKLWGLILSPFLWMFQRTDNILVAIILYGIMWVISVVLLGFVTLAFGWIAILPFWLIGMIDQVRMGNAGSAIFSVLMVLAFYTVFILFLIWCSKDTLSQLEEPAWWEEENDEEE